jgi:hypothetical protein
VDAGELFDGLVALPGSSDTGAANGISASVLLNGIEYARTGAVEERRLRALWKRRRGGGAVPLLLIADDPEASERVLVLGPTPDGPVRRVRCDPLFEAISNTADLGRLDAVRRIAEEVQRLDSEGIPGLSVRGLGSEHLYARRLPHSERWKTLTELTQGLRTEGWRDVLDGFGYELKALPKRGHLASADGRPIVVIHPYRSAEQFARLDNDGRLPEGALIADCLAHGAPFGLLAAGSRMRLLRAGRDDAGSTTRYLELDSSAMEAADLPLVGLLSPLFLAEGGLEAVLNEARDYGAKLRERLDRCVRQGVLPVLGRELGRWAQSDGRDISDERVRGELEAAALTFVFRALFLLYAESADFLPMANHTYAERSLTRIAARAAEELEVADPKAATLWHDITALVEAMRTGQSAWGVPAYNGDLFAADGFEGAAVLEAASIPDAALAPALVALARDPEDPETGIDFSGLEIGHLGHIYEGLLSLRLSVADQDLCYDERKDRYIERARDQRADVERGELLWLTNEGGRKGGGVYYTRTELVRHLVRESVRPAFEHHLALVKDLAQSDPHAAAARLFEFFVLDPACGSAHFLVEVVEELADQTATLLGEMSLPAVRDELAALRATAAATYGVEIEDTALLKRLVLKRCVYGVDLSAMGAEIAKVSLWLASFVPGLSLAYLDHNIQVGNSLVGVARPESVTPPGGEHGQVALFGDALSDAVGGAAKAAAELRAIEDRTPAEVEESREAHEALHERTAAAETLLDLWTAEPLGLEGTRDEALRRGKEILAGQASLMEGEATQIAHEHQALHWPIAFAEAFARECPGFDVVVGNPPWEEVVIEELAFYALYRPGLRSLPDAERRKEIDLLRAERPELEPRLQALREALAAMRSYLATSGDYAAGAGDPDLYKLFCQRYGQLLRSGGRLGVVLPRSAFLAKGSTSFRDWLFDRSTPKRIDFLINAGRWAFDSEPRYTVALLAAERRPSWPEDDLEVAGVARSAAEFAAQSAAPGLRMRRAALGPALEVPLLASQSAADLLSKLRSGDPFPRGMGRWQCFPVREFDETNDARLWRGATEGRPLWKGESFDQFDPNGAEARLCPPSDDALAKARKPRPGSGSLLAEEVAVAVRRAAVERTTGRARIAFRDVTRATDSRTVRASLVPPLLFLTNTAPYLAFLDEDPKAEAACLALMNSLVFDWQARRFVETHLNFFVLEGLRLPAVLQDEVFNPLAGAAARLSCVDERFAAFAEGTGVDCAPLDQEDHMNLRVEIDALAARAWDLTADELEVVLSDFTLDAVSAEYRDALRARLAG